MLRLRLIALLGIALSLAAFFLSFSWRWTFVIRHYLICSFLEGAIVTHFPLTGPFSPTPVAGEPVPPIGFVPCVVERRELQWRPRKLTTYWPPPIIVRPTNGRPGRWAGTSRRWACLSIPIWYFAAASLALFLFAEWRRRRFPSHHCQRCGYNLSGNTSGRCPECGAAIPEQQMATGLSGGSTAVGRSK